MATPSRRLLLVNPVNQHRAGFSTRVSSRFPPLNLGILAGVTPSEWEIELVDENFDTFQLREADLVAVTGFTSSINRGYEIASLYRQEGVPVVFGGIHASMLPGEALEHGDAVVVGEAEAVWPRVLDGAAAGRLGGVYDGGRCDIAGRPNPRRDLFSDQYRLMSIQTSRGCPMDCDFCSVTAFNGRQYRRRPADDVLDELETIEKDLLFFVDDNIIGYGQHCRDEALAIFRGMVERGFNKRWFCQASINVADDPEVLEWAGKAGCRMIFLGLEADNEHALQGVNKRLNAKRGVDAYDEVFRRIHAAGIAVLGAFIFGIDGDTPESITRRADYIIHSGVDVMQTTAMTPLPGTRLFHQLKDDGRLLFTDFPRDWDRFNLTEVVFRPSHMAADEFTHAMREALDRVYAMPVLKAKAKQTLEATGSSDSMTFAWESNLSYREIAMSETTFATA